MAINDFKLLVGGVDVSDDVIDSFNFTSSSASGNVPQGSFYVDSLNPLVINYSDEVLLYTSVDSDFLEFGGVVINVADEPDNFRSRYEVIGYAGLASRTDFTGRFRADVGTGNMKYIIQAILAEKFPDWTYDDDSIPDIDIDFPTKSFQDNKVSGIFDTFASRANRDWWVDNSKKFYFKERSFTQVASVIVQASNVLGRISHDVDDSRMGNVFRVLGNTFRTTTKEVFLGTGNTEEYILAGFPNASTSVQYSTGTDISVALEGSGSYDDPLVYDAFFKPDVPALAFNVATVSNGSVEVVYELVDSIREELPNAASIELYNFEKVKRLVDDRIASQDEAYNIAKNEYDNNSYVSHIYSMAVDISTQAELEDFVSGNNVLFTRGSLSVRYDILETRLSWSKDRGVIKVVRLNGSRLTFNKALADLARRVNQRDIKDLLSGSVIVKTLYWGGNVLIDLENIGMDDQDADDGTFVLQESYVPPDDRSLLGGSAIMRDEFTTAKVMRLVQNSDDHFRERFLHDFYVDLSESTGTLDWSGHTFLLGNGSVLQSREIALGGGSWTAVTPTITGAGSTDYSVYVKNENTVFDLAVSGVEYVFGTVGDGIKYRIVNDGSTTMEFELVEMEYR